VCIEYHHFIELKDTKNVENKILIVWWTRWCRSSIWRPRLLRAYM